MEDFFWVHIDEHVFFGLVPPEVRYEQSFSFCAVCFNRQKEECIWPADLLQADVLLQPYKSVLAGRKQQSLMFRWAGFSTGD